MKQNSSAKAGKLCIEIGCGNNPRNGFVRCDIKALPHVDYICAADQLPFEDNSVSEVYSRHLIEHLSLPQFLKTLAEWNRVLKTNGEVYIICPNLLWHLQQIINGTHSSFYKKNSGENHRYWGFGSLFGWQQDEYDTHKFGYYFKLLRDILAEFGFNCIEDLTNTGKGFENKPWHLEVKAKKESSAPVYTSSKFYQHFNVKH